MTKYRRPAEHCSDELDGTDIADCSERETLRPMSNDPFCTYGAGIDDVADVLECSQRDTRNGPESLLHEGKRCTQRERRRKKLTSDASIGIRRIDLLIDSIGSSIRAGVRVRFRERDN